MTLWVRIDWCCRVKLELSLQTQYIFVFVLFFLSFSNPWNIYGHGDWVLHIWHIYHTDAWKRCLSPPLVNRDAEGQRGSQKSNWSTGRNVFLKCKRKQKQQFLAESPAGVQLKYQQSQSLSKTNLFDREKSPIIYFPSWNAEMLRWSDKRATTEASMLISLAAARLYHFLSASWL